MKMILLSILVLLVQAAPPVPPDAPPGAQEYLVGPRDVLSVIVHNHDDMSRKDGITVEADGTIEYPLIGRVKVGGSSTRAIQDLIRRRLLEGQYLTSAAVTVAVKEYRSKTVWVHGEVRTPGALTLTGVVSLTEAISKAGHFTMQAGQHVVLLRAGKRAPNGDVREEDKEIVDRADIEKGLASHILLADGDEIFVPHAEVYYVTGHVQRPNEYIYKPDLTVLQAITIAGGYTDRAARNRLEIQRMENGSLRKISVKEHDLVRPRDTIHVPQRWW